MKDDGERHARLFTEFLVEHRTGSLNVELSESLNELLEAVHDTGRGGELQLSIKVKPAGKGNAEMVTVADGVKLKMPEADRAEAVFFLDRDFNLTRHNPSQPSLPLREVAKSDEEPREVSS